MDKTDEILERLKDWQPTLDNPDELTERIMAQLEPRPHRGPRALQYISTIAAVLLIGLFFFVNAPSPAAQQNTNDAHHNYISNLSGSTLKDVYTRPRKQDNLISYNQLRKLCYENK